MKIFLDCNWKHIMIRRMEPIWNKMGYFLSDSSKGCDVQLSVIKINQQVGLPIVLRLDGVYYDLDTDYRELNRGISRAHSAADAVIYQSEYGKRLCEEHLYPRKKGATYNIIPNGIKKGWAEKVECDCRMNIVVAAKWRRHKRLKEIIELFLDFSGGVSDVYLHIIGDLCENKVKKHPKIVYYGELTYGEMIEVYSIADLHIHLSKRDNCPNTVIEAMGAGVPVITTNLCGGATEACAQYPGGVVCYEGEPTYHPVHCYQDKWNILSKEIKKELLGVMTRFYHNPWKGELPEKYNIEHLARKYIEVLEETYGRQDAVGNME